MAKVILPIAIASVVLFCSCQPAAPSGDSMMPASSSSSAPDAMMKQDGDAMQKDDGAMMKPDGDSMMQGEHTDAAATWKVIADWSDDLQWGETTETVNPDAIKIDDAHTLDAGKLQTSMKLATVTGKQYGEYFVDKRSDLDAAMAAQGWQRENSLDADGPDGTQWGYIMSNEHGMTFAMISTHCEERLGTADKNQNPGACTGYEAKAMVTDTLVAGDDM